MAILKQQTLTGIRVSVRQQANYLFQHIQQLRLHLSFNNMFTLARAGWLPPFAGILQEKKFVHVH